FSTLSKGSITKIDKQAKEYVLRNIKATANTKPILINRMRYVEQDTNLDLTFSNVLNHYHLSVYDFYGKNKNRTFQRMLVEAGLQQDFRFELEDLVTKGLPKL